MKNPAQELFLMTTTLSQLSDADRMIKLFIESMNDIFREYSFAWVSEVAAESDSVIEVCTRHKNYGFVSFETEGRNDTTGQNLIHNATQLLAIFLEKTEQENLLLNQKNHLQVLVDRQTSELNQANSLLEKELVVRMQAEERLESRNALLSALINSPRDIIIFALDTEYRYTAFNEQHRREMKLVWNTEIRIGMNLLECMSIPELKESAKQSIDRALSGLAFSEIKFQPGPDIYYEFRWNPIVQHESIVGITAFITNITERKKAEEAVREQSQIIDAMFSQSVIPFVLYDKDWKFIRVNDAYAKNYNKRPEDYEGHYYHEMYPHENSAERKAVGEMLCKQKKPIILPEHPYIYDEFPERGTTYWDMVLQPLLDEKGEVAYFFFSSIEVTERKKTAEELRRLTLFQQTILNSAAYSIISTTPDGVITSFNPAAERLLGYTAEEVIDQQTPELWHDPKEIEQRARILSEELGETIQPGFDVFSSRPKRNLPEENEWTFIRKDGARIPVNLSVTALSDEEGSIIGFVGMIYDLTERKRVEDALRFIAQRGWQTSGENFFDALAQFLGEELGMDYVLIDRLDENPEMAETVALYSKGTIAPNLRYALKGTPCANVMGKRMCIYLHGIQQLFPDDPLLPGMGAESYIGIPLWDSTGQPIGLIAVMGTRPLSGDAPVTQLLQLVATRAAAELERERSDRLLRTREHQFRTLAANLPDNIVRHDREGRVVYVSPVLEKTLGADAAQMLGKTIREMFPDGRFEVGAQEVDAALASGENREIEFSVPVPGKDPIVHQIRTIVERDEQGEVSGVLSIGRDITERKRAEDELRRYRDQLEETVERRTAELLLARDAAEAANKAKSVFLANMSHELRTPMNAILGFSSMMRRDPQLTENQKESLVIINRSGEHLLDLINDVLEVAKIEAGRIQLDIAPFDLGGMVRDVTEMMQIRAQEKGLQLLLDQSSEFPRYIKGDGSRIRQIIINLISNAVKFTMQGTVTLQLGVTNDDPQHLLIEVEDTGPGIALEDQQRLFEPFVQLSESDALHGTGLGLTITRQFVQMMGGTIAVESAPGKGALFRIDLPVEPASSADIPAAKISKPGEVVGLAAGQPRYKIMIVEDQQENQLLLSRLMSDLGLEVKSVKNGRQCLELFQEWHPDLIWMDRRMPVMDGLEATRRLRQLPEGNAVKIIAVTASALTEQQQEMLDAGMNDIIRKPYRFDEIYDCLERQLGVKYIYRASEEETRTGSIELTPAMLSGLPSELRTQLKDAAVNLDRERIIQVISRIGEIDGALGEMLTALAEEFDYPSILAALDSRNGGTDDQE